MPDINGIEAAKRMSTLIRVLPLILYHVLDLQVWKRQRWSGDFGHRSKAQAVEFIKTIENAVGTFGVATPLVNSITNQRTTRGGIAGASKPANEFVGMETSHRVPWISIAQATSPPKSFTRWSHSPIPNPRLPGRNSYDVLRKFPFPSSRR